MQKLGFFKGLSPQSCCSALGKPLKNKTGDMIPIWEILGLRSSPGLLLVRSMIERRTQDFYLGSTLMTRSTGIYLHRYIHTYTEMYLCEFFCQTKHPVSCTWWPHSCLVCRYIPIAWRNVWPIEALSKSLLSKSSRPSSYMTSAFATLVPPIPLIKYQQIPGPGKILKTPFSCL